jgi:hypothetical protein
MGLRWPCAGNSLGLRAAAAAIKNCHSFSIFAAQTHKISH